MFDIWSAALWSHVHNQRSRCPDSDSREWESRLNSELTCKEKKWKILSECAHDNCQETATTTHSFELYEIRKTELRRDCSPLMCSRIYSSPSLLWLTEKWKGSENFTTTRSRQTETHHLKLGREENSCRTSAGPLAKQGFPNADPDGALRVSRTNGMPRRDGTQVRRQPQRLFPCFTFSDKIGATARDGNRAKFAIIHPHCRFVVKKSGDRARISSFPRIPT